MHGIAPDSGLYQPRPLWRSTHKLQHLCPCLTVVSSHVLCEMPLEGLIMLASKALQQMQMWKGITQKDPVRKAVDA